MLSSVHSCSGIQQQHCLFAACSGRDRIISLPNGVCFHCPVQVDSAFTCLVSVITFHIAFALTVSDFLIDRDSWASYRMTAFQRLDSQNCQSWWSFPRGTSLPSSSLGSGQSQGRGCGRCGCCGSG